MVRMLSVELSISLPKRVRDQLELAHQQVMAHMEPAYRMPVFTVQQAEIKIRATQSVQLLRILLVLIPLHQTILRKIITTLQTLSDIPKLVVRLE